MIRTEYTRQVPIRHWLPIPSCVDGCNIVSERFGELNQIALKEFITGYKTQRAWLVVEDTEAWRSANAMRRDALLRGQEVEGFEWIDEPIVGE